MKLFYAWRGENAWPNGCPSCGQQVRDYAPGDDDEFPWWQFTCGGSLFFDEKRGAFSDEDCPFAMERHLDGVIAFTEEPAPSPLPDAPSDRSGK